MLKNCLEVSLRKRIDGFENTAKMADKVAENHRSRVQYLYIRIDQMKEEISSEKVKAEEAETLARNIRENILGK